MPYRHNDAPFRPMEYNTPPGTGHADKWTVTFWDENGVPHPVQPSPDIGYWHGTERADIYNTRAEAQQAANELFEGKRVGYTYDSSTKSMRRIESPKLAYKKQQVYKSAREMYREKRRRMRE